MRIVWIVLPGLMAAFWLCLAFGVLEATPLTTTGAFVICALDCVLAFLKKLSEEPL